MAKNMFTDVVVTSVAITGAIALALPSLSATVPTTYRNNFRSCAGRLISVGIAAEAAASACSAALNPVSVSKCVVDIQRRTQIAATDALVTCRQVRRPNELATCVVGISPSSQETVPNVLDYCRRSLLPVRFAECVVGIQRETNLPPTQAMNTCIDASDPLGNVLPTFIPGTQPPQVIPSPTPQPSPTPSTPNQV